jgi:ADP-heptose:LPS heptosyltransferase
MTFRSLAASLVPNAAAVVLGGPGLGERAMAAPLLAALPEALDLVGAISLPQAAAVLQRAALFIGNDSGLMHLSAAAGAPTIGLFGPTDALTYGPVGRCATAVVATSMDTISVRQVVEAAGSLLA